jgi:hypothetical protein
MERMSCIDRMLVQSDLRAQLGAEEDNPHVSEGNRALRAENLRLCNRRCK